MAVIYDFMHMISYLVFIGALQAGYGVNAPDMICGAYLVRPFSFHPATPGLIPIPSAFTVPHLVSFRSRPGCNCPWFLAELVPSLAWRSPLSLRTGARHKSPLPEEFLPLVLILARAPIAPICQSFFGPVFPFNLLPRTRT